MDEKRRVAWESAIAKLDRGEEVPAKEHDALLREDMFKGPSGTDIPEEADLFLRYWLHGGGLSPTGYRGEGVGHRWFSLGDWDQEYGRNRSDEALQNYVEASEYDYDYYLALNTIAARLHRERKPFPEILADWAVKLHDRLREGTHKPTLRDRGNKGQPRYAFENRDMAFFAADSWLEHFGMNLKNDRLAAIAGYAELNEDVVRKAIEKGREISGEHSREPRNYLPWKCLPHPKAPKND